MEGRILLDFGGFEWISVFEGEYCFVFGPVVLVDATNIFPERNSPDEEQEQGQADGAIDEVEHDPAPESGIEFLELRRG